MEKMQIGNSDLIGSEIVMGTYRVEFMPDQKEVIRFVEATVDAGINYIDFSDIYGYTARYGRSDARVGQAIASVPGLRDKLIIQTKVGSWSANGKAVQDLSKKHVLESVDGSLQRLCTDHIDVLMCHRPDPLMDPEELADAFDAVYKAGKVRYFGISSFHPTRIEVLKKYMKQPIILNQMHVSIIDADAINFTSNMAQYYSEFADSEKRIFDTGGGILDYCKTNDIQVQAFSPVSYSDPNTARMNPKKYHTLLSFLDDYKMFGVLNRTLDRIGAKYGVGKSAIAMAWLLSHPYHIMPCVGSINPDHINELAQGSGIKLTREEWYDIYTASGNPRS